MPSYYFIPKKLIKHLPLLQHSAWWLEAICLRAIVFGIRLMSPARASRLLAWLFSRYGPHTHKAIRVGKNLQFVLPTLNQTQQRQCVKEVFGNMGRAFAELVLIDKLWEQRNTQLEFVATPQAETIMRSGHPLVLVTAHVGAWQMTNLVAPYYGLSMSIIYARETNPYLESLFYQLRTGFQSRLIPSKGGVRQLLQELKEGHSVGLAVDTRLESGPELAFFGVPTPTNTVPARMALLSNCPLLAIRAQRLGDDRFRITAYDPIKAAESANSRDEKILSMASQLNAMFEQWISEEPTQWMCFKRRWPKAARPATLSNEGDK